ncbi:B30.2/SPRY domain-containing protein [Entamoeba marina]
MKVSLHFYTFEDVFNFMMVCKKAEDTIKSLKVNPFFGNYPSQEKFMKHFNVETIKCGANGFFSPKMYDNVKFIRYPMWYDLKKEDRSIAKKLLPKVTLLSLYYSLNNSQRNKVNDFFIKEAIQFTSLQKIEGAIEYIVKFFENYTEKGEMMYVNFPKKVKILTSRGYAITFDEEFLGLMKQLLSYIPDNGLTTIDVIVYVNPPEEDNDLLKELLKSKRVNYHYRVIDSNQTTTCEDCLCCYDGNVLVDGYVNGDRFNEIFEKSYTTKCVIRNLEDSKEALTWNVPECISSIELSGSQYFGMLFGNRLKTFNANISMIQELSLKEVRYVNFPFILINLVKIKVEKSNYCKFILNSPKLKHISLRDVKNCSFTNSIESVKEIVISKVNNCVFPFVSFENRSIHIEDSNNLCFGEKKVNFFDDFENSEEENDREVVENVQSPLKFMEIELNDFNKLVADCLIYPSEIDLKKLLKKSTIFKMRSFHPQTSRVKVDGNVIQRVNPQGENGIDLVVSSKFYVYDDDLKVVNPKNPNFSIPAIIRYFEVEVQNYCIISIGLVDSILYEFKENRHVGWDKNSIGFHSDDGALYIEDGTNPIPNYGKAYGGKNGDRNIVGCGYNTTTKEVFYTVNGTKLKPMKINYQSISVAIGLREFDPITINYGDSPFVFDYYSEMEKYKQEHKPKIDDSELEFDHPQLELDDLEQEPDILEPDKNKKCTVV